MKLRRKLFAAVSSLAVASAVLLTGCGAPDVYKRQMLEAKAFLLSPALLGIVILLKHIRQAPHGVQLSLIHIWHYARVVQRGGAFHIARAQSAARDQSYMLYALGPVSYTHLYLYADAGDGESTTDMVFAGHNLIAENGAVLAQSKLFQNGMIVSEIDVERLAGERLKNTSFSAQDQNGYVLVKFDSQPTLPQLTRPVDPAPFVPSDPVYRAQRCSSILTMQASGLKKRLAHTGCKSAVVGISGGLDSTLALLVVTRAFEELGRPLSEITAVTMPCFGTTERTRSNAEKLCHALNVSLREVNITNTVQSNFQDIGQDPNNHDVTFENTQARVRTLVLMNLANQNNGLVIGTGDLSELALGWATYNGDHMSMYGVNASVPKTLVRHIVATVADTTDSAELRDVLRDILDTPVSPELLPAKDGVISQQTEEIVGPYDLHDFFLYYAVRWAFSPAKVFYLAQNAFRGQFEDAVILKWLRKFYWRFFSQQFKRSCIPDGPKVGTVTLSPRGDWRMPSDACVNAWIQELDHLENH